MCKRTTESSVAQGRCRRAAKSPVPSTPPHNWRFGLLDGSGKLQTHVCDPTRSVKRFAAFCINSTRDWLEQQHPLQSKQNCPRSQAASSSKKRHPKAWGVGFGSSRGITCDGDDTCMGWLECCLGLVGKRKNPEVHSSAGAGRRSARGLIALGKSILFLG